MEDWKEGEYLRKKKAQRPLSLSSLGSVTYMYRYGHTGRRHFNRVYSDKFPYAVTANGQPTASL